MKITFLILILLFITSFKTQEKPKITFEYNKELQEIRNNLDQANNNLKTIDSINHKK